MEKIVKHVVPLEVMLIEMELKMMSVVVITVAEMETKVEVMVAEMIVIFTEVVVKVLKVETMWWR